MLKVNANTGSELISSVSNNRDNGNRSGGHRKYNTYPCPVWWTHASSNNCIDKFRWYSSHIHWNIQREGELLEVLVISAERKLLPANGAKPHAFNTHYAFSSKNLTIAIGTLRNDCSKPGGNRSLPYTSPGHHMLPNFTQTMSPSTYAICVCSHIFRLFLFHREY